MNSRKKLVQRILNHLDELKYMRGIAIKENQHSYIRSYEGRIDTMVDFASNLYGANMISHEQYCHIYDYAKYN